MGFSHHQFHQIPLYICIHNAQPLPFSFFFPLFYIKHTYILFMALTLGLIYSVYDRQLNFYIKATSVLSFSGIVLNICNILMKKELLVPIETSPVSTNAYIDGPLTIC